MMISTSSHGMDRRGFLRLAGMLGAGAAGLAAVAALSGCGSSGGDEPDDAPEEPALPSNAVDFAKLVFTVDTDASTWWWGQINNPESSANGAIVVGVPVNEVNNDELSRVVNSLYCKVVGPDGEVLPDISGFYPDDDILQHGSIAVGGTADGVLHFTYAGAGTYAIQFDNLLGDKANLPFEVGSSQASGLRAYPADRLSQADAESAAYVGSEFPVNGMALAFGADPTVYAWNQISSDDPVFDNQWCVGVPLWIRNDSDHAQTITFDMYALYAPGLERCNDPGGYYQDTHVSFQPEVNPGDTVQTWLWWPYLYDGSYYVCIDDGGVKRVASVYITWPQ